MEILTSNWQPSIEHPVKRKDDNRYSELVLITNGELISSGYYDYELNKWMEIWIGSVKIKGWRYLSKGGWET